MKYVYAFCLLITLYSVSSYSQISSPFQPPADAAAEEPPPPAVARAAAETASFVPKSGERSAAYARKDGKARIQRFDTPPVVDGILTDTVWQQATVFGDFLQTQPGDNIAPSHPTEVLMGYDAKNLYIAFRIIQTREKVRASVARRDNIFDDDYVGVYLDTFNSKRQAYCLFFNPLGVQADGTFTEGNGEDYSLDIVMNSKGVLTPDGFTIEIAIPFKSLRYEAGKDKSWGMHVFRRLKYANNELNSWMPVNRSVSGSLNQAGQITGLDGIETSRQIEITPSFTLSETGRRTRFTFNNDPNGRYVNDGLKGEFGVTAKIGLTPTITLDFAYNPDFAQVEADAPVSTANVRFPIFFPEKRPFFLERIDIFESSLDLVNTRAIVDPDIAAKLTGRHGKNTFGIMYASDNAPGNYSKDERQSLLNCIGARINDPDRSCGLERFINQNADIGVLRLKRDVGKENSLGFFATTYNFVDLHNNTASVDGRFRFDKKTVATFQLAGTTSRRNFYEPALDSDVYRTGNGIGYNVYLERSDRNLYMNYLAYGRSKDYAADVGFTPRTDTNYLGSFIRYKTDPDAKRKIIYKRIQNATNISYDWSGRGQYFISDTNGQLALQRQTYIGGAFQIGREKVYENEFGPTRNANQDGAFFGPSAERGANFKAVQAYIESAPNKQLFFFAFMDYTAGIMDYDFGAGPKFPRVSAPYVAWYQRCGSQQGCTEPPPALDPGPGNQLLLNFTVRYQPTSAFKTQLDYNPRRLVRHDTGLVAFHEKILSSRSTYQFTRNTFARLRLDYSNISTRIRPQLVVGWTPNPGTALYVGYNDDLNYNGFNPYSRTFEPGLHGNGRSFFIKASYLFKRSF